MYIDKDIFKEYFFVIIAICLFLLCVYLIIRLYYSKKKKNEIEIKLKEFEGKFNTIQLELIESKLSPHLLKNILNSIQSHAYQTYFAIDKLANVLNYILYDSRKKYVTPKEEVEFALSLIEINKIKLSPLFELKVKLKINENEPLYTQNLLAPLICIDLIENAFKYTDIQSPDAFISVTFGFTDNTFSLTVANKVSAKAPIKKAKSGLGKESIEKRLQIIYEENYKLERFVEDDVYIAHLKINLIEHKAKMLASR